MNKEIRSYRVMWVSSPGFFK